MSFDTCDVNQQSVTIDISSAFYVTNALCEGLVYDMEATISTWDAVSESKATLDQADQEIVLSDFADYPATISPGVDLTINL